MSLPLEELAVFSRAILGRELLVPSDARTVVPAPGAMARLQRLHAAATTLAEDAPEVLSHPVASHGLEQALIEAMVEGLGSEDILKDSGASRQHAAIMRRFHQAIERQVDEPIYIPELCAKIAASERTLRTCCQEYLGMSPKRYLLLRRMHLVRRALQRNSPGSKTVTDVATDYGFWQFGRLAVEYKVLFGESPSVTLSRQPD